MHVWRTYYKKLRVWRKGAQVPLAQGAGRKQNRCGRNAITAPKACVTSSAEVARDSHLHDLQNVSKTDRDNQKLSPREVACPRPHKESISDKNRRRTQIS